MSPANSLSPSSHTLRQLKVLLPGGAIVYRLGMFTELWRLLQDSSEGWGTFAAYSGLGLGITTIGLFLYVLLSPWILGIKLDFRSWKESEVLSSIIPVLTFSIVTGWLLFVVTFAQYSTLGWIRSVLGVSGVYAFTFGLLGLIPAPKVQRQ